jgi:hypothetical protein
LLRDGARKLSSHVTSFARRAWYLAIDELVPWAAAILIVVSLGASLVLPILAGVWLWQQITN